MTFLAALGLLWSPLGVTLIRFLVWYNQCKTVWNTFKVQNLDHLVIFLQLHAVKTYTGTILAVENILPRIVNIFGVSSMF